MSALTENDKFKLRALMARSVSEGLDAKGTRQLEAILRNTREARQYYMECLGLYTDLYDVMGNHHGVDTPVEVGHQKNMTRIIIGALMSAAALVAIALWVLFSTGPLGPEVATLVDAMDVSASRGFPTQPGQRLFLGQGRQRFKSGLAHIRFDQGVDAVLEGPCTFEILSATELDLKKGRVFVRVEESGQGFQVKTDYADLKDLGTEFGLFTYGQDAGKY